jgi:translation initiation factor 4G
MDKPILEPGKVKDASNGKKKRKEILQKADASGSTSDLYNAYKGPEENKDVATSESTANVYISENLKQLPMFVAQLATVANEQSRQSKAELEDSEDVVDMSTPKLEVSDKPQRDSNGSEVTDMLQAHVGMKWLKLLPPCTDVVKDTEESATIKTSLIFLHIEHSSKEDGKGNS